MIQFSKLFLNASQFVWEKRFIITARGSSENLVIDSSNKDAGHIRLSKIVQLNSEATTCRNVLD